MKSKKIMKKVKKNKESNYEDLQEQNFDRLQIKQNQDEQYQRLLKNNKQANFKKNAYFFNHERYNSSKVAQQEVKVNQQPEIQPEEQQPQNFLGQALRQFKHQKKAKSKLLKEDIRRIEQEDEQFENLRKKQKTSNEAIQQSIHLKSQLEFYKDLIQIRYNKQNELENMKKYPIQNYPKNEQLNKGHKALEYQLFGNLNLLIQLYDTYSSKVFSPQNIEQYTQKLNSQIKQGKSYNKSTLNIENIYKKFTQQNSGLMKQAQRQMIKWSQKTVLSNISSSHYSSLIMQTPIGQTKKIIEQWQRTSHKCQQKRNSFKILFEKDEDIRNTTNNQIFDDFDLFNELEKIYVSQIEDQKDFRINDTLNYLKNRENKRQKTKDVDRKASKNRKLRFNVHAKLLNFIPSRLANLIQARDQIVENMFNCKAGITNNNTTQQKIYIDM